MQKSIEERLQAYIVRKLYAPEAVGRVRVGLAACRSFARTDIETGVLKKALEKFVRTHKDESFSEKLMRLIEESGSSPAVIYRSVDITAQHFSKIRHDVHYQPSKGTVLAFAIALKLSEAQTEELLGSAGYSLSNGKKEDVIVSFFIEEHIYDIDLVNHHLHENGCATLTNQRCKE